MYCFNIKKKVFLYFRVVWFMSVAALLAHSWNPNRGYHRGSGWTWEQLELRVGSRLF